MRAGGPGPALSGGPSTRCSAVETPPPLPVRRPRLERVGVIRQFVLNDASLDDEVLEGAAATEGLAASSNLRGATTSWDYLVSGSVLAAASQLSLLRGPGEFSPAQGLIVAPLLATARASLGGGGSSRVDAIEYYIDPRFSADPKFDARDYTQSLITLTVTLPS